jgi:hypothetical protein
MFGSAGSPNFQSAAHEFEVEVEPESLDVLNDPD